MTLTGMALRALAPAALLSTVALPPGAASAASPLAAMPVGVAVTYHITTVANKPPAQGGATSSDSYVQIKRTSQTAFAITVDGAPKGDITLNGGSLFVPPPLKKPLAPFGEVALLMKSAPKPLAANSAWAANLSIPIAGQTDNVAVTVSVSQFGKNGVTVVANGQNATDVRPALRSHQADAAYTATMRFNSGRVLTYATSNVNVSVQMGRLRSQHATENWTLSLAGA